MLSKLLSVLLFTLLASNQNDAPKDVEIGMGTLPSWHDKVLEQHVGTVEVGEGGMDFVYEREGGDVVFVHCLGLRCDYHTKTLIHVGACESVPCSMDVCTSKLYDSGFTRFVYGSSVDKKVYVVDCYDDNCVDRRNTTMAHFDTGDVSCAAYNDGMVMSLAGVGANMLWGCDRLCTKPFSYFEGRLFPFSALSTGVMIRDSGVPVMGFVDRYSIKGVFHYDLYLLHCADKVCDDPVFVLVEEGLDNADFVARLGYGFDSENEPVQMVYSKREHGTVYLKFVTCRVGYGSLPLCRDRVNTTIEAGSSPFAGFSMFYGRDTKPVITYVHGGAVKMVDCLDLYCNASDPVVLSHNVTGGGTSVVVNTMTRHLYVLYEKEGVMRLYTNVSTFAPAVNLTRKPSVPRISTGSPVVSGVKRCDEERGAAKLRSLGVVTWMAMILCFPLGLAGGLQWYP